MLIKNKPITMIIKLSSLKDVPILNLNDSVISSVLVIASDNERSWTNSKPINGKTNRTS